MRRAATHRALELTFTETGRKSARSGQYSGWDCLNAFYGATVTFSDLDFIDSAFANFEFKALFNVQPLRDVYAKLPEVANVHPVGVGRSPEDIPARLCVKDAGTTWDYILVSAGYLRDCESAPKTEAAFRVDAAGTVLERHHRDYPTAPECGSDDAGSVPPWVGSICR